MALRCKQCGGKNTNGTNFCRRKCRTTWIREHNIKGGRKRAERAYENELKRWGSDFSNEDYFDRKDD